jgi:hypothetical protein
VKDLAGISLICPPSTSNINPVMKSTEINIAEEISDFVLFNVGSISDIESVDRDYDSLYIEMKDGTVFHVSVMECEKED